MTFDETKRLLEKAGLRALVLRQAQGSGCLLIAPDLSGKIMAVSLDGPDGENFGFVNENAIMNRGKHPQFNAYGGALRWWIGPEGGQYGVAFPPGTRTFDLSSWHISEEYNGKPFKVLYPAQSEGRTTLMGAECSIENAVGTQFHLGVSCRISLTGPPRERLGGRIDPAKHGKAAASPSNLLRHLGYLCETTFVNLSNEPMRREKGLLSIWLLGMYLPSPQTCVIVPYRKSGRNKIVTDTYFSPDGLSADRLRVHEEEAYLAFRADGKQRSKIGLSRSRACAEIGSIDLSRNLLTLWRFPIRRRLPYVNSLWEWQKRPYGGDVINSYNDDGKIGDFYELECSSHALSLQPGERSTFPLEVHHFCGPRNEILQAARQLLKREIQDDCFFPAEDHQRKAM